VHFTNFVDFTCQLQDAFSRRGFARVDVGEDADIAIACQVFHQFSLSKVVADYGDQNSIGYGT
jgi:hypothetical protein